MSSLRQVCPWSVGYLLAAIVIFAITGPVRADPKPLSKEEQAKVDKAIDKGVTYLKRTQRKEGDWQIPARDPFPLGHVLLLAYALLESGISADDAVIQKAVEFIRPQVQTIDRTYEVALTLLVFDRLGNPKDKPLIRSMACRLIAGQHLTGGWNYRCPTLTEEQEDALLKPLAELNKRLEAGQKSRSELMKSLEIPRKMAALPVFVSLRYPPRSLWRDPPDSKSKRDPLGTRTDNSNTQFAMLGLWVAQRYDVPVGPTFRLMVDRFENTQAANSFWPYSLHDNPNQAPRPSMLCVGLIALAIGRGLNLPTSGMPRRGSLDPRILRGFVALRQDIADAAAPVTRADSGGCRGPYYLWSVERVAVLYNLSMIGDQDWYRWGVKILIDSQRATGEWQEVSVGLSDSWSHAYVPAVNTAFALLFLKRSHPMKDLTPKLPYEATELSKNIRTLRGVPAAEGTSSLERDRKKQPSSLPPP